MKKETSCTILFWLALSLAPFFASAQALNYAVSIGDTAKALQLLQGGASPNKAEENGSTPFMTACRWGDVPMINILLANGATVYQPRSPKGRTPLMVACAYSGGNTVTKILLHAGADANAVATDGTTALMLAAKNAKLDVVEILLAAGADPLKKDVAGLTALDYAQKADPAVFNQAGIKDCQLNKEAVIARLTPISH
ncbi:MAG: ankyrin repeat family protein [Bacteroidota bacterium]|nr:ankyrin repeat family protein [Bacteroidota bacterium]